MKISKSKLNKLKKAELVEYLMAVLEDEDDVEEEPEQPGIHSIKQKKKKRVIQENDDEDLEELKRQARPQPIDTQSPRKNRFDKDKDLHKEDVAIDKILSKTVPKRDKNRPSNVLKLICTMCQRKQKVPAGIVLSPKRFRCNDCITGR